LKVINENGEVINQQVFSEKNSYNYYFEFLFSHLSSINMNVIAVGHRVVHGGMLYKQPVKITSKIINDLKELIPFAPLHQPFNIEAIEIINKLFPKLNQFACFDTSFHRTHPPIADYFGLPRKFTEDGIRRYGFHGLSYEFIIKKLKDISPQNVAKRIVIAHLGNGASMCAVKDGKSIDSTMGFTALDGLVMGTRCGAIDPGVLLYFMQFKDMNHKDLEKLLYTQSGLLGVSNISSNMQELLNNDSQNAKEAVALFIYRIRKELGALSAALSGLDCLIFTGGIGENASFIREKVCEDMQWLGITLDSLLNQKNSVIISDAKSTVEVLVIPTDEEQIIATHTFELISKEDKNG
jgi:acetate kinase